MTPQWAVCRPSDHSCVFSSKTPSTTGTSFMRTLGMLILTGRPLITGLMGVAVGVGVVLGVGKAASAAAVLCPSILKYTVGAAAAAPAMHINMPAIRPIFTCFFIYKSAFHLRKQKPHRR